MLSGLGELEVQVSQRSRPSLVLNPAASDVAELGCGDRPNTQMYYLPHHIYITPPCRMRLERRKCTYMGKTFAILIIALLYLSCKFYAEKVLLHSTEMPPKPKLNVQSFPRPPLIERTSRHLQVKYQGQIIADTKEAYWILETYHAPSKSIFTTYIFLIPKEFGVSVLLVLLLPSLSLWPEECTTHACVYFCTSWHDSFQR